MQTSLDLDSKIRRLLRPHKTVRDPIHGDIYLNHFETEIMDTKDFQRLHSHKQLGLANLVYPGVDHSRFQHLLGTLFIAGRMIETVNMNASIFSFPPAMTIGPYGILLTRTGALLHDLVNIPFGHSLEDEGLLVDADWDDQDRVKYFFDTSRDPRECTISKAKMFLDKMGLDGMLFVTNLQRVLTLKDSGASSFEYAYAADIIGNTFCADMSDYLERDLAFTGINAQYRNDRSRVIPYLFIPKEGRFKGRLVIRLWHKRFKDDVASETLFTLTLRYYLAERVYFHHAKNVLSGMLIAAVQRSGILKENEHLLYGMGDEQLLDWLENAGEPARSLVQAIRNRSPYEIIFQSSNLSQEPGKPSLRSEIEKLRDQETGADYRLSLETSLTDAVNSNEVKEGDILIYCPDPHGNLKVADTRVLWSVKGDAPEYVQLKDLKDSAERIGRKIGDQIKTLEAQHSGLWALLVLVRSSISIQGKQEIAALCSGHFKVENEVEEYSEFRRSFELRFGTWAKERNVPPRKAEEVLTLVSSKQRITSGIYREVGLPTFEELDRAYEEVNAKKNSDSHANVRP